jgi:hypothetical protein
MRILALVWKIPTVVAAVIAGAIASSQAGWSGAELIINSLLMGTMENLVTTAIFFASAAVTTGTVFLVYRIAKPALWIMAPILLYSSLILGVWNGFASDFDATRVEVIKHGDANAYALDHMSARGRYRTCKDQSVRLTDDAKAVCQRALSAAPGEVIRGSEHRCGLFGMFACVYTAPEK